MGADEKHAATYHGTEYTPATAFYVELNIDLDGNATQTNGTSFYSWLETVRAEAKAEALNEVLTVLQEEIEDAPPANHEEDNYEAGYIAGLDFLLNTKARDNQHKGDQS